MHLSQKNKAFALATALYQHMILMLGGELTATTVNSLFIY